MNKFYISKLFLKIFFIYIISLSNLIAKDAHNDLLKKLDDSFPAEIFFTQIDNKNTNAKGWMVVGKKGLARVEFEPPNHFIMVADGSWLIVHDAQYDRTSYLPLDKGILGALLHPQKFNSKNRLSIGKIKNNKGSYYSVTSEDFEGSELRVYFDNSLKVLKGWDIIENEKISIKLNILEIRKLENLNNFDKNIFKFSESMRANLRGFLGPYKRKLKRLPTSNTN